MKAMPVRDGIESYNADLGRPLTADQLRRIDREVVRALAEIVTRRRAARADLTKGTAAHADSETPVETQ